MQTTHTREYTMSDVTRMLGITASWVKTREKNGLLPAPRRTPGGHRTYNTEELHAIRELAEKTGLKIPEEPSVQKAAKPVSGTVAVINQKGGVGKTTVTQNLGIALARKGYDCLLVDLDRQANLTTCFGVNIQDEPNKGLAWVLEQVVYAQSSQVGAAVDLEAALRANIIETGYPHVHLLPNNIKMFDVEPNLRKDGNSAPANFLRRILKPVMGDYNFILIDCPPDLGVLTLNGIRASKAVIIPVDHDLSLQGIKQLNKSLYDIAENFEEVPILGVVLNKHSPKTNIGHYLQEKIELNLPGLMFKTQIGATVKIQESQVERKPLYAYEPRHATNRLFDQLADEFIDRMRSLERGGGNGA